MKKEKKITLEDLALMIQSQFKDVDGRFNEIDGRFNEVDVRLDKIDGRLNSMDQRLNIIEALLASNRIERLEDSMRQVKTILKIK